MSTTREEALENPMKRRRLNEHDEPEPDDDSASAADDDSASASFRDLNVDCLVHVMSFLSTTDDMNSLAVCTERCREARNNQSLDQTRTGTIICTNRSTFSSLLRALHAASSTFTANYTHLKIVGLKPFSFSSNDRPTMNGITCLEVCAAIPSNPNVRYDDEWNLHETKIIVFLQSCFPNIRRLALHGISLDNRGFNLIGRTLTELSFDDCELTYTTNIPAHVHRTLSAEHSNRYLLMNCEKLERLSIKGTTLKVFGYQDLPELIPQGMLMKMVRRHRTLRWLRSDLSADNVAILQQERPEVTFVSS